MSDRTIKLSVISDVLCPWCYIGFRELQGALAQCSNLPVKFDIEVRPYQLNPGLAEDVSVDRMNYLMNKLGPETYRQVITMITARGAQLGIKFAWSGKFSQSTKAHRLLLKAYQVGGQRVQQKLLALLFKALYEEGQDCGDVDMLANRAELAGLMTHEQAVAFLQSDENLEEVTQLTSDARKNGVTGVPFAVIDGKWAISGAQTADVYVKIFEKLATCQKGGKCSSTVAPMANEICA